MQHPSSNTSLPTGSGNYKRLKTLPVSNTPASINDLSVESCCIIADFLPKTSRALLAVALTAPPSSFRESGWKGQPNAVSKAIISRTKADLPVSPLLDELCEDARAVTQAKGKQRAPFFRDDLWDHIDEYYCKNNGNGNNWNVLDFVDLPMSLATRLSDDDVGAILVCIDAKNELEQLTLTHCTHIVGHGLEPLRSSTRLEALNLGLAVLVLASGRGDNFVLDDAKLSEGPVCGIVDGIISEEGNALKRLQFPYTWAENSSEPNASEPSFVFRSERMKLLVDEHCAFVNKFACCVYFGYDLAGISSFLRSRKGDDMVDYCQKCFSDDYYRVCSECSEIMCCECCDTYGCDLCETFHCPRCIRYGGAEEIKRCRGTWDGCPRQCSSCRWRSCRNGNICEECRSEMFGELLDECNSKQVQIDSQNDELERLRLIIEEQERTIQANQKFSTK